ncbi:nucleotide-binding protein [Thermomonospora echinospora]|uniref:nucleotide-binding protein n=1 Tax=Thermomonospora echinospora TaxID=1992 RepID=UPI000CDE6966|nr:hypothetical protein [Thermomonospora echinospora]
MARPPDSEPVPPVKPAAAPSISPDELVARPVHGDSLLRRIGRGAVRPFVPAGDVQALAEHGRWIQHPVTTGRRIAVTSLYGGAGKSTLAALIASVFARYRQDRVLALDLDPELGSLPLRLGIGAEHALADLVDAEPGTASFEQIQPYLAHLGGRLWGLAGTHGVPGGPDAALYRAAGIPLSRFFGVTVTDCGAGIHTELHRVVLAAAHAQVLVAPTTGGAAGVGRVLDWMSANGLDGLAERTLVVFTVQSPHNDRLVDVPRAAQILAEVGVGAIKLGYDRHVAVGATLDPARLAYATRVTAIAVAAEALRRSLTG